MSIPKTFIDQVLDQTDIVEVVGRRVPINKKGANYWGVCPFHDDHKPSMAVNQDKQFYYCFVCQASGNSINFLREYENLDFTDAVETLASSLGLEVPYEKMQVTDEKNYSILDDAVKVFEKQLKESETAINYLKSRNISGITAKKFQLGFAAQSWDSLYLSFENQFEKKGLVFSGMSPDNKLPEIIELNNHPWFIGVQFHPEFRSRPLSPHPLFSSFIKAAKNHK